MLLAKMILKLLSSVLFMVFVVLTAISFGSEKISQQDKNISLGIAITCVFTFGLVNLAEAILAFLA